jgi:hypothetical protein
MNVNPTAASARYEPVTMPLSVACTAGWTSFTAARSTTAEIASTTTIAARPANGIAATRRRTGDFLTGSACADKAPFTRERGCR